MKVDILAIGVHPDDVELGCGGTILKHVAKGYKVGIVDLTQGELGTRGSKELRQEEAEKARLILGAEFRDNLKMSDGFFENNKENITSIVKVIRKYQPEIVLCNAIDDRHPDHGRAAKLTSDACFYSGLIKFEVQNDSGENLLPWRPKYVYHYIQDRNLKADFSVDITAFMGKKMEAVMAFSSQFKAAIDDGPQTPISGDLFYEFLFAKARAYGRDLNVDFAEGFTVERTPGINDLFALI
jgi:bacillithiol biosynthesis deacetylase BshB1